MWCPLYVYLMFTYRKWVMVVLKKLLVVSPLWQALVDAPDMVRSQMNFKRLSLTDIKIDINRVPKKKNLIEAMEKAGKDNYCLHKSTFAFCSQCPCFIEFYILCWQMWRTSGRIAHGAESLLSRREGLLWMTLIDSSWCWLRSRLVIVLFYQKLLIVCLFCLIIFEKERLFF